MQQRRLASTLMLPATPGSANAEPAAQPQTVVTDIVIPRAAVALSIALPCLVEQLRHWCYPVRLSELGFWFGY
jgi:hypothetical protein